MNEELIRGVKEILCRQCDGISHADTCELDKAKCPVLKTAPNQLIPLISAEARKQERERIISGLKELMGTVRSYGTMPTSMECVFTTRKQWDEFWQALKEGGKEAE